MRLGKRRMWDETRNKDETRKKYEMKDGLERMR